MPFQAGLWTNMSQNYFKKIALRAIAGIVLLFALVALLFLIEQRRTQSETSSVLSALFSEFMLKDMDEWAAGRTTTIVVMRTPDCRPCVGAITLSWFAQPLKSRWSSVSGAWFSQTSRVTRTSFFLNSVFPTDMSVDLHLPSRASAVFVKSSDLGADMRAFEARFPNNMGYFAVSHIGLNLNKNEALLYVDRFCPGLCGGGAYVLLHKVNGVWHVVDLHSTWVS